LNAIYHAQADSRRAGADSTAAEYRRAFAEGRLKKRKMPARGAVKVWIEPPAPAVTPVDWTFDHQAGV
jgi:hypothetical protein